MEKPENILGYGNGFIYFLMGKDVFRADYSDNTARRWFSTISGFYSFLSAYGLLSDEEGNKISIDKIKEKCK